MDGTPNGSNPAPGPPARILRAHAAWTACACCTAGFVVVAAGDNDLTGCCCVDDVEDWLLGITSGEDDVLLA